MVIIITLNYDQNKYTLKCVESILNSVYDDFQVLLIDNGSTYENFEELKKNIALDSRLKLFRIKQNVGYVGGINYGLKEGVKLNPDYFLIMNNDTIIDENAIFELSKTCKHYNNKAIVTGKVYHYDAPNMLQDIGYSYRNKKTLEFNRIGLDENDDGQYDKISERDILDDVFWLFSIDLYNQIGGYSPYFWFNSEQADFALRAKNKGFKLIFTPMAKLWHKGSITIGGRDENPKLAYWHMQSTLILRFLHLSKIEFAKQYFKNMISILSSYYKSVIKKNNTEEYNFDYPNAKLKGMMYFNKWYFIRNKNKGKNPFI